MVLSNHNDAQVFFFLNSIFRVDYIVTPLKILQSLKESVTPPDEKYSFVRRLSPQSAAAYNFTKEEVSTFPFPLL